MDVSFELLIVTLMVGLTVVSRLIPWTCISTGKSNPLCSSISGILQLAFNAVEFVTLIADVTISFCSFYENCYFTFNIYSLFQT